jgi:hypothetical protein
MTGTKRQMTWVAGVAAFAFGALAVVAGGQAPPPAQAGAGPVVLTNQQDRQRMMDMLKISGFPSGPGAYLASTYDEALANPYPNLPDPLVMNNGTKVTSAAQWRRVARSLECSPRSLRTRPANMPR